VNSTVKSIKIDDCSSDIDDVHKFLSFVPNLEELEIVNLYVFFIQKIDHANYKYSNFLYRFDRFDAYTVVREWKFFSKLVKRIELCQSFLTRDLLSELFEIPNPDIEDVLLSRSVIELGAVEVLLHL